MQTLKSIKHTEEKNHNSRSIRRLHRRDFKHSFKSGHREL